MVVEYELTGPDLGEVRFAVSPLNELVLSLRAIRDPGRFPLHLPWLREVQSADLGASDRALLRSLTNDLLWTPDFLNPRPRSPLATIDTEFDAVAEVSGARVRDDLAEVHPGDLPAPLRGSPGRTRDRILATLRRYWSACFAPHWPRMRALLEADIVHRDHVIVQSGC